MYYKQLPYGTTVVPTITYTASHDSAFILYDPAANVNDTARIIVTSEDGLNTNTYMIIFSVASEAQNVLFMVRGAQYEASETIMANKMTEWGYNVTSVDVLTSNPVDYNVYDVLVISEAVSSSDVIPFKPGYAYYYGFAVYAKGPEIEFKERIKLSGPTFWGDSETGESLDNDPNYEVSEDKSMITVTRNTENIGSWFNYWELTKEDPKGEMIIEILFKDEVVHTFKFLIE